MNYRVEIDVMPLKEILDPQGKAVAVNIKKMGFEEVKDVRIGKHINMLLEAPDEATARNKVEQACQKLLANPIIEYYEFSIFEE